MSRLPMPVVVGVLLVLAGVAVARNVLFFSSHDTPRAAEDVASVDLVPTPATVEPIRPLGPPEVRMRAWLAGRLPSRRSAPRDPFHLVRQHGAAGSAATVSGPHLQGVLMALGRATALVDGAPVAVGGRIGDARVTEITSMGVRLTTSHGDRWLEFQPWSADAMVDGGD